MGLLTFSKMAMVPLAKTPVENTTSHSMAGIIFRMVFQDAVYPHASTTISCSIFVNPFVFRMAPETKKGLIKCVKLAD